MCVSPLISFWVFWQVCARIAFLSSVSFLCDKSYFLFFCRDPGTESWRAGQSIIPNLLNSASGLFVSYFLFFDGRKRELLCVTNKLVYVKNPTRNGRTKRETLFLTHKKTTRMRALFWLVHDPRLSSWYPVAARLFHKSPQWCLFFVSFGWAGNIHTLFTSCTPLGKPPRLDQRNA